MGYGAEEGRKYWILNGICRGGGKEVLNTKWDMERKKGGSTGYLMGYVEEEGRKYLILSGIWRGRGEEVLDTRRSFDLCSNFPVGSCYKGQRSDV